jgi:eukaryotic-like serine/threonine-protein kinase
MKVEFKVTRGAAEGKTFKFKVGSHETVIFGRDKNAKGYIPDDDYISRNHFLIEVMPPHCSLRDLGSKNGTYVNEERYSGCPKGSSHKKYDVLKAEVALSDGDNIKAGETTIQVSMPGTGKTDTLPNSGNKKAESPSSPPDSEIIRKLNNVLQNFIIENELRIGGMGAVFLAHRTSKKNEKAVIKIILPLRAADKKIIKRFRREGDELGKLRHENIVEFYNQGYVDGIFYMAMEYLEGGDLRDLIMQSPGHKLSKDIAAPIMLQCLEGLAFMHEMKHVHRDIKPANVLLKNPGSPKNIIAKIADFGLAKNFQIAGLSGFTVTGMKAGDYHFMSPDQLKNFKYAKPPVDVYSMGATFYKMLTGLMPMNFPEKTDPLLVVKEHPVIPIRKRTRDIPPKLAEVIDKSLQTEDKPPYKIIYKNAGEMLKELKKAL